MTCCCPTPLTCQFSTISAIPMWLTISGASGLHSTRKRIKNDNSRLDPRLPRLDPRLPFGQLNPRMKKETKKIELNATNDFCDGIIDAILS